MLFISYHLQKCVFQKFYYRCRLKQKSTILRSHGAEKYELRCLTGTNDCVINCTGDWHVTCPKCRFEKCIFMGIGLPPTKIKFWRIYSIFSEQHCRNFKPPTERNKSLMPVSATRETQLVQKVIDASDVFLEELSQTPLMVRSYRFENTTQAWSTAMYNFEQSSTAISKLLKSMPGFQSLDMAQRCSLFGKFFSNCFTAASSRVISGAWIGSPENGEQLLRFVPEMTVGSRRNEPENAI